MASGDTLAKFFPRENEEPAVNAAGLGVRGRHPLVRYPLGTNVDAVFSDVLIQGYAGGGIRVVLQVALETATTGNLDWEFAFDRITNLDADSYAAGKSSTGNTVPGLAGDLMTITVDFLDSEIDGVGVGDLYRLRSRCLGTSTAAGSAELRSIEMREL